MPYIPTLSDAGWRRHSGAPPRGCGRYHDDRVGAVAAGDLTPSEASELSKVVDGYARTLQAAEFEERISKLEKAVEAR